MFKVGDVVQVVSTAQIDAKSYGKVGIVTEAGRKKRQGLYDYRVRFDSAEEDLFNDCDLALWEPGTPPATPTPVDFAHQQMSGGTALKDNRKDCKPPLKYLHPEFFTGTAFGMLAGELKYAAWNFIKGHDKQDLTDGAIRHLLEHRAGNQFDDDTTARLAAAFGDKAPRVKHLWLAACNINMMLWQEVYGTATDSLPPKGGDS